MKKLIIAVMTLGALSSSAFAADGQINFTGSVTDDACTVTNKVASPLTVPMGKISSQAFTGVGSRAGATRFTIDLTNCPATVTSAKVKFDGTNDSSSNGLLKLTQDPGVATGVAIQIADVNDAIVPLQTASLPYTLQTGTNSLAFFARYYATAATVKAGPANSTSSFTIVYN